MMVTDQWKAICELAPAKVLMRPADKTFYVHQPRVDIIEHRGTISSPTQLAKFANGAVMECFSQYTKPGIIVVVDPFSETDRKELRWNPLADVWQPAEEDIDATHLVVDGPPE